MIEVVANELVSTRGYSKNDMKIWRLHKNVDWVCELARHAGGGDYGGARKRTFKNNFA
ncbi:10044_t:CDS:1, partial [Paraglomus occultum]